MLLTLPLGLALIAACLHAYPYGGARVEVFAAPSLALLIAAGVPPTFGWLRRTLGMRPATRGPRHSSGFSQWRIVARSGALLGYVSLIVCLLSPLHLALYHAVVPWERPDCARAAAYVLAHCRPKDGISANQWAYSYYFRWVTPGVRLMGDRSLASDDNASISAADRQWFVITADDAADRKAIVRALPLDDWRVLDWRDFALTTVLLLGKK